MITLAQAEALVKGKVCPKCLHTELTARLHLQDESECLCTARCEHCGASFNAEFTTFESLEAIQRQLESALTTAACDVCGRSDFRLRLACDRPSQDCYFEARCRVCHTGHGVKIREGSVRLVRLSN